MKLRTNNKPAVLTKKLISLIVNFKNELKSDDLRKKVITLIPVFHNLRNLGKSLIDEREIKSARDRILFYFLKYPLTIINGDELLVVSAIQEYARRIRELRVQFGWSIINGITANEMLETNDLHIPDINISTMRPNDYILITVNQDKEAAYRWNIANDLRKRKDGVRNKLLEYFKINIGKTITGEELRYVANNRSEWARRVRELRTEYGWPIITKNTGRPDMFIGSYMLESLRQSPEHDRHIPDTVRGNVLRRDGYACIKCGWDHNDWNRSDPRHLELHYKKPHVKGGKNIESNLITLCIICHDEIHRINIKIKNGDNDE